MLENITIARPYAAAAFSQAHEDGDLDSWSGALEFLGYVVSDPDMRKVILDPRVGKARLTQLLLDIGGDRFGPLLRNFVGLLVENERVHLAADIGSVFEKLRAGAEGTVEIEMISAYALSEREQQRIANAVAKRLGRQVEVATRVDKDLIGGAVVRVGDLVLDASVRGRLNKLEGALV